MMPNNPKVHLASGINAYTEGDTKSAVAAFLKVLSLEEKNEDALLRLAETPVRDGKIENGLGIYTRLLEQSPLVVGAHIQKAEAELLLGQVDSARRTLEVMRASSPIDIGIPAWNGEDLTGKRVVLYTGFGLDEFNVLTRLAKWIHDQGATVFVECTAPMRAIVDAMEWVDQTFLPGEPLPTADCHASLEWILGMRGSFDLLSSLLPCFAVNSALKEKWDARFKQIDKPKIGLMWRKETHVQKNAYHSVPLSVLMPLLAVEDVHFVSLQTGSGLSELNDSPFKNVLHSVGLENAPMDERLACLSALDLLITPDTLTAQVTAAAGLPVWILLGAVPKWHYGLEGDHSPIHPTARFFRQKALLEWTDVAESVASALREFKQNRLVR